jgi:hypothetical protein
MVSRKGSSGEDKRLIEADHQCIDTATACELTFNAVVDGEGVFRLADIQNSGPIVGWSIRRARIPTNVLHEPVCDLKQKMAQSATHASNLRTPTYASSERMDAGRGPCLGLSPVTFQ